MAVADKNFAIQFILIGLTAVILIVLVIQYNKRSKEASSAPAKEKFITARERFEEPTAPIPPVSQPIKAAAAPQVGGTGSEVVRPSEPLSNEDYKAVDFEIESKLPADCFPRDRLTTKDLLPKDAANSKWAEVNPAGQGDVGDQNFLTAGFHVGVDTIGQSLRNANYQLRSEPPNPRIQVSPWNQTTIEYDNGRRQFELGEKDQ